MPDTAQAQLDWAFKGLGGVLNLARMHLEEGPPPDPARMETIADMTCKAIGLYIAACKRYDEIQSKQNLPPLKHAADNAMLLIGQIMGRPSQPTEVHPNGETEASSPDQPLGETSTQ